MAVNMNKIFFNSKKILNSSAAIKQLLLNTRDQKRNFSVSSCLSMRFVQYTVNGGPQRLGAQICTGGDIFDISAVDSTIPNSLPKFLAADKSVHERAKRYKII